jgi:hypothetical protein
MIGTVGAPVIDDHYIIFGVVLLEEFGNEGFEILKLIVSGDEYSHSFLCNGTFGRLGRSFKPGRAPENHQEVNSLNDNADAKEKPK